MLKLKVNPLIAIPYTPTKRAAKLTIQPLSTSIRTSYSFYKLTLNFFVSSDINPLYNQILMTTFVSPPRS